jgi:glucuronoarabinoxylan endo-1,4-beta-xylanase
LPESSVIRLSVIDLTGHEVAVIVNGTEPPGEHEVTFDASDLASGVYLCRLRAGSNVQTRKMLLLR